MEVDFRLIHIRRSHWAVPISTKLIPPSDLAIPVSSQIFHPSTWAIPFFILDVHVTTYLANNSAIALFFLNLTWSLLRVYFILSRLGVSI